MNKKKIIKILDRIYKKPLTCLTAYSPSVAKILDGRVDFILIGDSLGSTLYGMQNSRGVTMSMMINHGKAVKRNVKKSVTIIDMPYKTYETKRRAFINAKKLMNSTGVKLLKLEINRKNVSIIKHLSDKNINVISHIGVTPQSFKDFRKIRSVGRTKYEKEKLINLALLSEKAGAKCLLLECVSTDTAKDINSNVSIPTIGIGSSKFCDGQVLVFDDLINMENKLHKPKFVKNYMNFEFFAKKAVNNFIKDVNKKKFPNKKYSY